MAEKGRRGRRMSVDPDTGFVRPLDLQGASASAASVSNAEEEEEQSGIAGDALPGQVPDADVDSGIYSSGLSPKHKHFGDEQMLPLPESVDHTIPDIGKAWAWFLECDRDRSGVLEFSEMCALGKALGLEWSKRRLRKAYDEMCQSTAFGNREGITFEDFANWWARYEVMRRRDVGRAVKEMFQHADEDGGGILDKEEFGKLLQKSNNDKSLRRHAIRLPKRLQQPGAAQAQNGKESTYASEASEEPVEHFELEAAWNEIRKVPLDTEGKLFGVNFAGFENWWKQKTGMIDPDIPVLPEFMVLRIADKVKAEKAWSTALSNKAFDLGTPKSETSRSPQWTTLREKLLALVRMRSSWGELHDIYETRQESLYEENPLPPFVRDPESTFSAFWDLLSVVMLLYVTLTVPLRVCFGIDIELWTTTFWIELVVDLFFVCDVVLNFRTSFYDANGFRENRPARIARNYLKKWFLIDFVSCLPFGYVQYFIPEGGDDAGQLKAIKSIRLMKITKMMRLARLKRIVMRHGGDGNFQQWQSVIFTLFTIVFMAHMLSCFWYLVGESAEQLGTGTVVPGWVEQQDGWGVTVVPANWTDFSERQTAVDPRITLSVRYLSSMCYVLNALENATTSFEMGFSVFAELMRDVILGLVASLITTISMSASSTDTETELRLRRLRAWMAERKLPKGFRKKAIEHFTETWTQNYMDLGTLLSECPPAMAANMAVLLYGRYVATVPLFKGLSQEVLSALCLKCKPMTCMKNQNVIQEGEPGKEMYMLVKGEVEVTEKHGKEVVRLGFLAEGAFFGEAPVLGWLGEPGVELRMRTVRAVTDIELIYLSRDDVNTLCEQYAELRARMSRFEKSGRVLTKRALRKIDLSTEEVQEMAAGFKSKLGVSNQVREDKNLHSESFVPSALLPSGAATVLKAATRFKKIGAARRAREEDDRADKAIRLKRELDEQGGLGALMLESRENKEQITELQQQMTSMQELMQMQFDKLGDQLASMGRKEGSFRMP